MSKLDPEHINIATALQEALALKREIVLDFTSLKACLDPQREKLEGEEVMEVIIQIHMILHILSLCNTSLITKTSSINISIRVTLSLIWRC